MSLKMINKILIVGPSWVGDMVMAQTLFKLLKKSNNDVVIDVLAPDFTLGLLERMPEVTKKIAMPLGHGTLGIKSRYQLGKILREENYDQAIILPNSFKSALVPWFAKIPKRTGFRGEMRYGVLNDLRVLDKERYPLMVDRFMALGLPKGALIPEDFAYPLLTVSEDNLKNIINKLDLKQDREIIALCPGAEFGSAKRWPEDHYAKFARKKLDAGASVWIFGSPKDAPVAKKINELTGGDCEDLTGKTSLCDAIDLLSLASLVISNDSGLMHVAAALDKPLMAIYGPTTADFTPPLTDKAEIHSLQLACQPCFQRECPLEHHKCMKELTL